MTPYLTCCSDSRHGEPRRPISYRRVVRSCPNASDGSGASGPTATNYQAVRLPGRECSGRTATGRYLPSQTGIAASSRPACPRRPRRADAAGLQDSSAIEVTVPFTVAGRSARTGAQRRRTFAGAPADPRLATDPASPAAAADLDPTVRPAHFDRRPEDRKYRFARIGDGYAAANAPN